MKRFVIAGAVVVAALGVAARRAEPSKVVYVDMSRLVSEHRQSREEQQAIRQWYDTSQKLLDEKQKQYKERVGELDQFAEDSDDYRSRAKDLKIQKFTLESEFNSLQEEFKRKVAHSIAESHARVVGACKTYLDANDLDGVLQYASTPVGGSSNSEVIPEIVVRTVVAHRKSLDVSDAILAILDAGK
jgi:Skp family chaperone for outer membrane proteins